MPDLPAPPGMIYGVLLNDPATLARLGEALQAPPYKSPPKAPVLYVKPAITRASKGAAVPLPADPGIVRVDATIGAVIGRRATRVQAATALAHVRGWVIASDLMLPTESVFRPAVRQRCRDGFLPMSEEIAASRLPDPGAVRLVTSIDGVAVHRRGFASMLRSVPQLLVDITDFMTLDEGDVLLLGPAEGAPLARAGQSVRIEAEGLGELRHTLVAEPAEAVEAAR